MIKELSSEQARQSSVADQAAEPCSVVLKEVHRCGRLGATHEELCIATGLAKTRLSAALHDLKRDKLVIVIKHGRGRGEPIFVSSEICDKFYPMEHPDWARNYASALASIAARRDKK